MKTKNLRTILTILLGLLILWAVFFTGRLLWEEKEAEPSQGTFQREIPKAMVQVTAGGLKGSGVIYGETKEDLIIITAAHVLEQARDTVEISFWGGMAAETGIWQKVPDADLAFIQVPLEQISLIFENPEDRDKEASYEKVFTDREGFDKLQPGDGVIVVGSKDGAAANVYEGSLAETWIYLEDFSQYMMLVQAQAKQGMSGGGVFDKEGRFIGILCGGSSHGELAVLPFSIIEARYIERF